MINLPLDSLPITHSPFTQSLDPKLAVIIESAISRLQDGEEITVEELVAAHPEFSEQLRELLPAMKALIELGNQTQSLLEPQINCRCAPATAHEQLGDFRIIRELGHGGMGTVFEAEQLSMGRRVALKVLPFAALANEKSLQRFRNEVRAAAALDHPHIVSVYSIGEDRGVHFYAMQLIRGQTLADFIQHLHGHQFPAAEDPTSELASPADLSIEHKALPATTQPNAQARISTAVDSRRTAEHYRTAARLGMEAAEALQHAHDQGVLHRDIKPSNLLLDGEGKLFVTDFGLARIVADVGMTMTGDMIGTLRYMAPEQALAKKVVVDHRADVYSLGATLYELVTLQPAFDETDRGALLKQIAFDEPKPLRKWDRHIPADLETIVFKAMAKIPEDRYQTAQLLASDLGAFLEHRPIQAKPPTLWNQSARWSRRHVGVVWTAAVAGVLMAILSACAVGSLVESRREAQQLAGRALSERQEALRNLYRANVQIANYEWKDGRVDLALKNLEDVIPKPGDVDFRRWEWYFVKSLCQQGELLDGYLITAPPECPLRLLARPDGGTVTFIDLDSGLTALSMAGSAGNCRLTHDGSLLALINSGVIEVYDLASRSRLWNKGFVASLIEWSPDGGRLFTVSEDGSFTIWEAATGSKLLELEVKGSTGYNPGCAWSPDGKQIAIGSSGGKVRIWDAKSGKLKHLLSVPQTDVLQQDPLWSVAWNPKGDRIIAAGRNSLWIWNLETLQIEKTVPAHRGPISAVAWSPDGRAIASAGLADGIVKIWEVSTGEQVNEFRGHTSMIYSVAWLKDGLKLASKCSEQGTFVWQRDVKPQPFPLPSQGTIAWTPAGLLVSSTMKDDETALEVYDPTTRSVVSRFKGDAWGKTYCLAIDPTDQRIASGHIDGMLRLWDRRSGELLREIEAYPSHLRCIDWSPDGNAVAISGGNTKTPLLVLDSQTGEEIVVLPINDDNFHAYGSIAWSPDGSLLAAYKTRVVQVWRTDTWEVVFRSTTGDGGEAYAHGLSWSPAGDRFATATGELVNIWDMKTRRHLARFRVHGREANSIAWSPDGSRIATGGDDHLIKIWDAKTGRDMLTLGGHTNTVAYLTWSPDGRMLASSNEGELFLWDATPGYR